MNHNPDREPQGMCWDYNTRIRNQVDTPLCPTCKWYVEEKGKWYCTGQGIPFQPDAKSRDPCESYKVK